MHFESIVLFGAGFLGGVINSIAGGGSFITFPMLLFTGIPPISANATNTFASCSGYIIGTYAFRGDLLAHKKDLRKFLLISLFGGIAGAWLLLRTPSTLFREAIPWLLLFAVLLFVFGGWLNNILRKLASRHRHASSVGSWLLLLLLFGVCAYGGFFNAGLGIVILSYLALAGYTDINAMNGLKLLVSSSVSLTAVALFSYEGVIAWGEGALVFLGALVGGYVAAHISRQVPQPYVRAFVIVVGVGMTAYFFTDVYGG